VGHALRSIEEYQPTRDHALPAGVIASFGVHTESHVPRTPIAVQVGPSVPLEQRSAGTIGWILQKGLSDLVTALGTYALQQDRLIAMCDVLRHPEPTLSGLRRAASTDSVEAQAYDRRPLPQKLHDLRTRSGLDEDLESGDLETRILTINRARNCLEHRGGLIGPQDCAEGAEELVLEWVGPDLTDGQGSAETIEPGQYVETLRVSLRAKRRRTFKRGTMLTLSSRDFVELCWTVNAFGEVIQRAAIARIEAGPPLAQVIRMT